MHGFQLGKTILGCDILIDLPCDRIKGTLNCFTQLQFSHISAVEVLGAVFDLLVFDQCPGIIALFKSRCVDNQRFDRTAGLSVALESSVQRKARIDLLGSSTDHGDNLTGAVVDTDSSSLHLVFAVVCSIREVIQFLIYTVLKLLLLIHVECGIDLVSALEELGKACVIELIVDLVISRPFFITGKVIPK